jgi:hypothetical protein
VWRLPSGGGLIYPKTTVWRASSPSPWPSPGWLRWLRQLHHLHHLNCTRALMLCPFFPRSSTLPRRPFLVEAPLLMVGRAGFSSRSHSLLSDLHTQPSVILLPRKHVAVSAGRACLSSQVQSSSVALLFC